MKALVISIVFFTIGCNSLPKQGFTNKIEAKNEKVNGVKEGKWLEYLSGSSGDTTKDTNAPYYCLTIYMHGKPFGIAKEFYKSGKIESETPYIDGKKTGVEKVYFENGKISNENPYTNDTDSGITKMYWENGLTRFECPYTMGKINGTVKFYSESGKILREILWANGNKGETKIYDSTGHVIK